MTHFEVLVQENKRKQVNDRVCSKVYSIVLADVRFKVFNQIGNNIISDLLWYQIQEDLQ